MKSKNVILLIIVIFSIIFTVLALPSFHIQLFGKDINFNRIDPSTLLTSDHSGVWHLQRSVGIAQSKEYTAELTFPTDKTLSDSDKRNALNDSLKVLNERIEYAYLYDVKARGEIANNKYFVTVTFPSYYTESDILFPALVGKGDISFLSTAGGSNPNSISAVDLKDSDIEGPVSTYYETQLTSVQKDVLQFKFKSSKVNTLAQALANSQKYFLMLIDGNSFAVFSTGTNIITQVDASPLGLSIKDERQLVVYLNIMRTYFLEQPLTYEISTTNVKPVNTPADFNSENVRFIVITFIISVIGLILGALVVFRREGLFKMALMLAAFIPFYVFILKVPSAVISIYSILGFSFVYILASVIMWKLINAKDENINIELNKYRDVSIFLFILVALTFKLLSGSLGFYVDFLQVAMIGLMVLIIMTIFIFRWILNFDYLKK